MTRNVEICIPLWNEEKRIESVLCAIRAQTYQDFVVRIYDNASDDRTIETIQKFQNDIDIEICSRTTNIGQNMNINRSFSNCTSPYIALLSGNDVIAENYLEALLDKLVPNPDVACAYAKSVRIDDEGRPTTLHPKWKFFSLIQDDPIARTCDSIANYCQSTNFFALYRRSILDRVQPQPFRYGGDHVLAGEVALYGKVAFADDTSVACSPPPFTGLNNARNHHLLKLFSLDRQRGLECHTRLSNFEEVTPFIDLYHGYLEMFRLADVPYETRTQLIMRGTRAFLARWGGGVRVDIRRIVPVLRSVSETQRLDDPVSKTYIFHALRKADECLLIADSPELIVVRDRLSSLYNSQIGAGIKITMPVGFGSPPIPVRLGEISR